MDLSVALNTIPIDAASVSRYPLVTTTVGYPSLKDACKAIVVKDATWPGGFVG